MTHDRRIHHFPRHIWRHGPMHADAMPGLHRQRPQVAKNIFQLFANPSKAPPHVQAAQVARQPIQEQGREPPPPVGNNMLSLFSTMRREGACTPPWVRPARPRSTHKPDPWPAEHSPPPHTQQRYTEVAYSDHIFRILLPNKSVGAVAFLTPLATTVQPAPGQGSSEAEGRR